MLDVQTAIKNATKFLATTGVLVGKRNPADMRLEEVHLSEDGDFWFVTLSYYNGMEEPAIAHAFSDTSRTYREFRVRADDGQVIAMEVPQWLRPQLKAS